jgi:hypothetical protein
MTRAISLAIIVTAVLAGWAYFCFDYGKSVNGVTGANLSQAVPDLINFSKYQNSSFGMSMEYPTEWKKVEDNTGSWFRNANESVNVRIESLPGQNRTMFQLLSSQLNLTRNQFPGQVILESNDTTMGNNYPAHKIVFTFPEEPADPKGTKFKELKVWTISGNNAYVITYFTTVDSYDYFLPIITKMTDSFNLY